MACVSAGIMSESMHCSVIPYRRTPHPSKLFLQFIEDFSRVAGFYQHPPDIEAALRYARELKFPEAQRAGAVAVLREQNKFFGSGTAAAKNLDRLERGAVVVVTGQQVGLFSGPAYSVYKALTAIQVAEEMSEAGVPAVPVFWLATEDHDLAEVNHCLWLHENKVTRFELPDPGRSAKAVGKIVLGPQVESFVQEASSKLSGPGAEPLAEMLRVSYKASDTYGTAFGKLFARLFEEDGLILLDPLDPRMHRLAAPVLWRAMAERDELHAKLLERGKQLDKAGFAPQVKVTSRSTLLFRMEDGKRLAIALQNKHYQAGDTKIPREDLLKRIEAEPESFSPNALLRPVLQDALLPAAAYVAGPAEIAYCAQSEVLYRHLLGRMAVVLPRASFTIVEPKVAKLLQKYKLSVEDVWAGREKLRSKLEAQFLPASLARQFEETSATLEKELKRLETPLRKLDATLADALDTAHRKMTFQLEKLRQKAGRAREERESIISGHEEILTAALYPDHVAQQRGLCFLPFLAAWGLDGLAQLRKLASESLRERHEIVVFP